jgi:hypothetical protein
MFSESRQSASARVNHCYRDISHSRIFEFDSRAGKHCGPAGGGPDSDGWAGLGTRGVPPGLFDTSTESSKSVQTSTQVDLSRRDGPVP